MVAVQGVQGSLVEERPEVPNMNVHLTDEMRAIQLQALRERTDQGLAQAERGEGLDGDVFMQGLLEDLDAAHQNAKLDALLRLDAGCPRGSRDLPRIIGRRSL